MPEDNANRDWERLLADYRAACAAFDAAHRVSRKFPLDLRHFENLTVAELAEDKARESLIDVRRRMRKFDPEHPESLPIG